MIEQADTNGMNVSPLFAEFYGIELTDDDLIEVSEMLESVCPGLGCWFLDHDVEFQRDMLAGAKLFWERREGPCKCHSSAARDLSNGNGNQYIPQTTRDRTPLRIHRQQLGLTQEQFAKRIGIGSATLFRLESGYFRHVGTIHGKTRQKLESTCGRPLEELVRPVNCGQ